MAIKMKRQVYESMCNENKAGPGAENALRHFNLGDPTHARKLKTLRLGLPHGSAVQQARNSLHVRHTEHTDNSGALTASVVVGNGGAASTPALPVCCGSSAGLPDVVCKNFVAFLEYGHQHHTCRDGKLPEGNENCSW